MKTLPILAAVIALGIAPAFAQDNNANPAAPGQDRVCLVTTGTPNSFNDVDVVGTKWLPRKAAEAQARKDPSKQRVFDYTNDPLVTGGQYASAEELCNTHFAK
jgi:hypothetical protein